MDKKTNLAERIILFLVFFVFAVLVVAFAYGWDDITGAENTSPKTSSGYQYVTASKPEAASSGTDTSSDNIGLVNINTATLDELETLPGIGEKKAQAILDYRAENGPFGDISEIKEVSGIGDGIFEKIRSYITVG